MSRQIPEVVFVQFIYYRCKLQNTGSNVTRMTTKVRLTSQHVVLAHDDSGSYHSTDAKLPLPRLHIPVVLVGHNLPSPSCADTSSWVVVGGYVGGRVVAEMWGRKRQFRRVTRPEPWSRTIYWRLAVVVNLHHGARAVPAMKMVGALVLYGYAVTHLQSVERLGGSVVTGEELHITFGKGSLSLLRRVQPLWVEVQ